MKQGIKKAPVAIARRAPAATKTVALSKPRTI
jgi:hypothetical protein